MIFTLSDLHNNPSKSLEFKLDFSKEINDSSLFVAISEIDVVGSYYFYEDFKIEFEFEVSFDVTILAADTSNPIEIPMHVVIKDLICEDDECEYKINDGKVDLYELIWGWVAAELPTREFEHN